MAIGCVIMASGMGERFGGNKLMAQLGGKPMIEWILDCSEGLFESRIVVTRHPSVRDLCRSRDIPVLLHDSPLRSDTIRLGITAIGKNVDGCMFCPGDQPLLHRNSLMRLRRTYLDDPECMLRLGDGAPAIFPKWTFAELEHLPEGCGGNYLMKKYPERVRSIAPERDYEMIDADTPEMLAHLQALLRQAEDASPAD